MVEEAIKYIDELHMALFRRAPLLVGQLLTYYTLHQSLSILCGDYSHSIRPDCSIFSGVGAHATEYAACMAENRLQFVTNE